MVIGKVKLSTVGHRHSGDLLFPIYVSRFPYRSLVYDVYTMYNVQYITYDGWNMLSNIHVFYIYGFSTHTCYCRKWPVTHYYYPIFLFLFRCIGLIDKLCKLGFYLNFGKKTSVFLPFSSVHMHGILELMCTLWAM